MYNNLLIMFTYYYFSKQCQLIYRDDADMYNKSKFSHLVFYADFQIYQHHSLMHFSILTSYQSLCQIYIF